MPKGTTSSSGLSPRRLLRLAPKKQIALVGNALVGGLVDVATRHNLPPAALLRNLQPAGNTAMAALIKHMRATANATPAPTSAPAAATGAQAPAPSGQAPAPSGQAPAPSAQAAAPAQAPAATDDYATMSQREHPAAADYPQMTHLGTQQPAPRTDPGSSQQFNPTFGHQVGHGPPGAPPFRPGVPFRPGLNPAPLGAAPALAPKYAKLLPRGASYADEFTKGSKELGGIKAQAVAHNYTQEMLITFLKDDMGWEDSDLVKWFDKLDRAGTDAPDKPVVEAVSPEALDQHEVHGGSPMAVGRARALLDTGASFSKFSRQGFSIFVMDGSGRIFVGSHKVGLFHHSSLLAGADVAAAGEMKVEAGSLKALTNKSGHYKPQATQTLQILEELRSRGVNLAAVQYKHITPATPPMVEAQDVADFRGGAQGFYDAYQASLAGRGA